MADVGAATALRRLGGIARARAIAERVINTTDGLPREQANGYLLLSTVLREARQLRSAADACERAAEVADPDDREVRMLCRLLEGTQAFTAGRYPEALGAFRTARDVAESCDTSRHLVHLEFNIGQTLFELGRPRDARRRLRSAARLAAERRMPAFVASAHAALAESRRRLR